jgi:excisionase family DNA binding protein
MAVATKECDGGAPPPSPRKAVLTIGEVAATLRISPQTVRRLWAAGKLPPPLPLGRSLRWSAAAIERWLATG